MPARLEWDANGQRFYETGIDHVVLYVKNDSAANGTGYDNGVAWNGVTAITENPSGAEPTAIYADNIKYLNLLSPEEFGLTLEALWSPEEFDACDGTVALATGLTMGQQKRKEFALCYRTLVGNDTDGNDYSYDLHIVYNCLAAPTERAHNTVNDTPETETLSWTISTTPKEFTVNGTVYKPSAHVVIHAAEVLAIPTTGTTKMNAILDALWGSSSADAKVMTPADIYGIITGNG